MGWFKDILGAAVDFGKFVLLGDKGEQKLQPPLGELETEKRKQAMVDKRRDRASRRHGGGPK